MDIASMVLFLCSDKAGFITGENKAVCAVSKAFLEMLNELFQHKIHIESVLADELVLVTLTGVIGLAVDRLLSNEQVVKPDFEDTVGYRDLAFHVF